MLGLQKTLGDLLRGVGGDPSQPQEVSRKFGLDKMLTWRVSRVVCGEDLWDAVQHVPRRPSLQILANAMRKHGASEQALDAMWVAVEQFERFIDTHAGDRDTLEIIASTATRRVSNKRLETFRRDGYLANSAIWGVCARVHVAIRLVYPAAQPGMLDLATVCGFLDFRRLRPDVSWAVGTFRMWDVPREVAEAVQMGIRPLVPSGVSSGAPLVERFCSKPLPEMRRVDHGTDSTRFELCEGPVGSTGSATVILGWLDLGSAPIRGSHPGECGEHGALLTTPAELSMHDLYVHESLDFAMSPSAHVYGMLPGGPQYTGADGQSLRLPVPTELQELGDSSDVPTPEYHEYAELLRFTLDTLGLKRSSFQGFRFRMRYPPIPAMSVIRHGLLPAADSSNGKA